MDIFMASFFQQTVLSYFKFITEAHNHLLYDTASFSPENSWKNPNVKSTNTCASEYCNKMCFIDMTPIMFKFLSPLKKKFAGHTTK